MRFFVSLPIILALARSGASQSLSQSALRIATPMTLVQCQPYLISITGGTPPYNIRVTEAGNIFNVIETIGQVSTSQTVWTVNIASGNSVTLYVVDSTGQSATSGMSNSIGTGSGDCLNKAASIYSYSNIISSTSTISSTSSTTTRPSTSAVATSISIGGSTVLHPTESSIVISTASSNSNVGAIAGGSVAGLVVLTALGFLVAFCCIRKRRHYDTDTHQEPHKRTDWARNAGLQASVDLEENKDPVHFGTNSLSEVNEAVALPELDQSAPDSRSPTFNASLPRQNPLLSPNKFTRATFHMP